jgi:pimeloyl-ACP methyl ester carboxylesterase
MAVFERLNASIFYQDIGFGVPVVTLHGLGEDSGYWVDTGVAEALAKQYRIVSMDMRGHGQTRVRGRPYGYDVATVASDIGALADALDLGDFHLVAHATGGMAAIRFAIASWPRLRSLSLTSTGSATLPPLANRLQYERFFEKLRRAARKRGERSFSEIMDAVRAHPAPFLSGIASNPRSEEMWRVYEGFLKRARGDAISEFMLTFYTDPDPLVDGLRQLGCPTLVIRGELDEFFRAPSELLVAQIPGARYVVLDGVGHMTAIEAPERTSTELFEFLLSVDRRQAE